MSTPSEVVRGFLVAVEAMDLEAAMGFLAEDVSYENVPMDPIAGRHATEAVMRGFLGPVTAVEWRVLREVEVDRVVINERLDRFRIGDGWLELPVAGFFEVDDEDRISLWRDYFDMGTYMTRLAELTTAD